MIDGRVRRRVVAQDLVVVPEVDLEQYASARDTILEIREPAREVTEHGVDGRDVGMSPRILQRSVEREGCLDHDFIQPRPPLAAAVPVGHRADGR